MIEKEDVMEVINEVIHITQNISKLEKSKTTDHVKKFQLTSDHNLKKKRL